MGWGLCSEELEEQGEGRLGIMRRRKKVSLLSFSLGATLVLTLYCLTLSSAAFDRIVTQLAQAAGPSADRPPPATSSMIHSLPSIPIDSILLCETTLTFSLLEVELTCLFSSLLYRSWPRPERVHDL